MFGDLTFGGLIFADMGFETWSGWLELCPVQPSYTVESPDVSSYSQLTPDGDNFAVQAASSDAWTPVTKDTDGFDQIIPDTNETEVRDCT